MENRYLSKLEMKNGNSPQIKMESRKIWNEKFVTLHFVLIHISPLCIFILNFRIGNWWQSHFLSSYFWLTVSRHNGPFESLSLRSDTLQISFLATPILPSYTSFHMLNVQSTVKHILINCDRFRQSRTKDYQTSNLKDLFKNKPEEILSFLKETNLFIKI